MDGRGRLRRHPHFLGSSRNYRLFGVLGGLRVALGAGLGWTGVRGIAGGLELFQLAEASVDGTLQVAFVAGEFGERVGTLAIYVEGARQEITSSGGVGGGGGRLAALFGRLFLDVVHSLADLVLYSDILEAVTVDTGL